MENNISTKHHTIPQFYLNNFGNKENNNYRIYVYNKNKLLNYSNLVKNVGYIKDFNTVEIDGEKTDIFEVLHNEIFEKFFSKILVNVINKIERYNQIENYCYNCMSIEYYESDDSICLDYEDKKNLAYLLAYFIFRSRKLRNFEENVIEKEEEILNDIYRANGYTNDNIIKSMIEKQIGKKDNLKIGQLVSLFKGKQITELAEILYNHNWTIAYNNTEKLLYTSDNAHAIDTAAKYKKSVGYDTYGNIIIFPISPRICILMYDKKMFEKVITDMLFVNLDRFKVKNINYELVFDGIDEIYSKDGNWQDLKEYYRKNKLPKGHKPYRIY